VGERTAAVLWEAVSEAPEPLAAFLALELGKAPAGARAGLLRFRETMRTLKKPSYFSSPAEAIRYIVDDGGYGEVAKGKFPNPSARLDDLEALAQFALAYDDVGRFLEEVTLFGDPVGEDQVAGEEDDEKLVLSSVHQAKGLEWKAVFVLGLQEDRFPNLRAARTPEGLEEERRLFYVAVTRAKDELMLVHPLSAYDRYGVVVVTEPSRFLRELPEALYERWVLDETVDATLNAAPDRPLLASADPTLAADDDEPVN
jgi:DNA helicase-2/ATP-dependent DNA helicase PcrA